jgi:hypothetical protein
MGEHCKAFILRVAYLIVERTCCVASSGGGIGSAEFGAADAAEIVVRSAINAPCLSRHQDKVSAPKAATLNAIRSHALARSRSRCG